MSSIIRKILGRKKKKVTKKDSITGRINSFVCDLTIQNIKSYTLNFGPLPIFYISLYLFIITLSCVIINK